MIKSHIQTRSRENHGKQKSRNSSASSVSSVYCLGPSGTFSHEAAVKLFPKQKIAFAPNFDALFTLIENDKKSIGIVPIENSLHGSVDEILDLLKDTKARIWRTHDITIKHAFGAFDPKSVTRVASHPQALRQCRRWLKANYPLAEYVPVNSTAHAVQLAAQDSSVGAIASLPLIKKAGLTVIARDTEGEGNTTRFAVVALHDPFPGSKRSQTSIVLHPTTDRPGLLHQLLTPFKVYDLNLTRIESRPSGNKFGDYIFFVDFIGTPEDQRTKKVFEELGLLADIQVLGEW